MLTSSTLYVNPLITMNKISIIIATFNAAKTLSKTLDSVLNQTYQDWECIIVDGASRDNTINIVKEYIQKDTRFRYISEPDKGIYDAFNKGWKMATGKWIYYLGADDTLIPNGLYKLMCNKNIENYDVIYGSIKLKWPNGTEKKAKNHGYKSLPYKMLASHQAIVTKRSVIEYIGGFDINLKIIGDKDLYIRIWLTQRFIFKEFKDITIALFSVGGVSSNVHKMLKENIYVGKKNNLGTHYIIIQYIRVIYRHIKNILRPKYSY